MDAEPAGPGLVAAEAKKGKPGPTGPAGPVGAIGPVSTSFAVSFGILGFDLGDTVTVEAVCPDPGGGTVVLDGGFDTSVSGDLATEVTVTEAFAVAAGGGDPARYVVSFTRTGTVAANSGIVVFAFAICSPYVGASS